MKKRKDVIDFWKELEEDLDTYLLDEDDGEIKGVIPTGATSLDVCTGIGGIPLGRFTEIYGPEASGKTTLALSICKSALDLNLGVLYIDAEQALNYTLAKSRIRDSFNKELFHIMQPRTMEQGLDIAEKGIRSGEFGLIVLDSLGSLAPKKVFTDKLDDDNVALLSRRLTVFVQRNSFKVRDTDTAFLGINQVRDKIGSYFSTYETPGGHTWKHLLSLKVQLGKLGDIIQGSDKIGINAKFIVKKNKLAPPFRTFTIPIMFDKGVDTTRDLIEFATTIGVMDKSGAYYKFEGNTLGSTKGLVNTIEYLNDNKETLDKIIKACYNYTNVPIDTETEIIEDE